MKGIRIFASRLGLFGIVSLLLAAVSGAVLADAQPASPAPSAPPAEHLLLVPDTPQAAGALGAARVVARYESFSLVEAAGEDDRRLRAAGAQRRDDMREVATAAGAIDPEADRASLAGKRAPDRHEALALVQFVGPPKEAWVERLRATRGRVVTYQAENAYVVHARGSAVDRLAGMVGTEAAVRAVIPLGAADKVEGMVEASARYAVSTVAGRAGQQARAAAAAAAPAAGPAVTVGAVRTQYLRLSAPEVAELARDPAVVAIERDVPPEPSDERASQIVAGNLAAPAVTQPSGPGYLAWHDARFPGSATFPFAIDITDTGFDDAAVPPSHADFRESGLPAGLSRVAYALDYTGPPESGTDLDTDASDCTGHGTNVASAAAGYNTLTGVANEDAAGYQHGLGVAPRARIGVSKVFQSCSAYDGPDAGTDPDHAYSVTSSVSGLTETANEQGAVISNNSWGAGTPGGWGEYTPLAREYDALVRDAQPDPGNQQMVEVFAAGNDGGYGKIHTPATAKNVITVGASESVRTGIADGCGFPDSSADNARDIASFSNRGPTDDGRLKPDLVAPGTRVTGARPTHADYDESGVCPDPFAGPDSRGYSLGSGTSSATPQVSGATALVRDWYQRTEGAPPSPALTKALLVNTATDLAGGQTGRGSRIAAGPNADQGWGRLNLGSTFDSTQREFHDQDEPLNGIGQRAIHAYTVPDPGRPVKVTLVWTDPPGPSSGNSWVNNLDLEVAASGRVYKGNVFDGAASSPGGAADVRNNVESVYFPPGTSGRFSVTVRATNLAGDGVPGNGADVTDQDFALVISNAEEQPASPVLVAASSPTVADPAPSGDADGTLEPGERVELGQPLLNAGNGAASGLSATLSGGPGVTITQRGSAYPDLAQDAVASNTSAFGAQLAGDASCGADATFALAVGSTAGSQTLPFSVPTGAAGPVSGTSTQVANGVIGDDDVAGVSSSVLVTQGGRIKDLDVTLGSVAAPGITHTSVGDLVIDLVGPDGTSVRLANHPGGPDNFGNDLAGTTFDDEAAQAIGDAGTAAPYTGSFRPQSDRLSRFDGKSWQGLWTLRVRDLFAQDTGTLRSWGTAGQQALCDFAPPVAPPPPPPPTPAASFVLAPVEEDLAESRAGRFTVLAACASACRASATIGVPARTARRLHLGRKAASLGRGAQRRRSAGTAKVAVRLSRRARVALRGRKLTKVTLKVTLTEGKAKLTMKRTISLRREAGLKRMASRGLRLWAACARRCPLSAELTLSAAEARRVGLKPGRAKRYEVAAGRTTASRTPKVLAVKVRRSARKALARARRVGALLKAVAGVAPNPLRTAKLSKTLRR